jgi:hypothetical protein
MWQGGRGVCGLTSVAGGSNLLGRDKVGEGNELWWRLLPLQVNDDYNDGTGGGRTTDNVGERVFTTISRGNFGDICKFIYC